MLNIGDMAPDVEVETSQGEPMRLSDFHGERVVLFFYPKAFTSGCTIETRKFAQAAPELEALGARVVGVSIDSVETQKKFAQETCAEFPLVGDKKGELSKAFGVKRSLLPISRRVTFIIGPDGKVEERFAMELKFEEHVTRSIEYLKERAAHG